MATLPATFIVEDIHRRNVGAVVVVGVESVSTTGERKVFPASLKVSRALESASARELAGFLGAVANVDPATGFVFSFTTNTARFSEIVDVADFTVSETSRRPLAAQMLDELSPATRERVDAFDLLNIQGGK